MRAALRPRLRLILAVGNVLVLVLPLAGLGLLRIYDNALIRQTEAELIAQGAVIASVAGERLRAAGLDASAGRTPEVELVENAGPWRPRPPRLDLARRAIAAEPPDPAPAPPAPAAAAEVGRGLEPLLEATQRVTLAGIRVTDRDGTVIASTAGEQGLSLAHWDEVAAALEGRGASRLRRRVREEAPPPLSSISRGAAIRVFVTAPVLVDDAVLGAVVLSRTPRTIEEAVYAERLELALLGVALLAAVLALALITSFAVTRPVHALIAQVRRAVRGERGAVTPLARPVTRELAELSESVARMASTLEERAEYIRTFASHVSHEFKTPLTAIRGAAELIEEHGEAMSEAERARFVRNVIEDAARLESLVRRLLQLARADTLSPSDGESADAVSVVRRLAERERATGVELSLDLPEGALPVAMDAETLDSILTSLVDNAFQHGAGSAQIVARPSIDGEHRVAALSVQDDGPGISAENATRVFEPFFTTARERGGTGLGLAIVAALVRAHQGAITLGESARGTRVELRLPGAPPGRLAAS